MRALAAALMVTACTPLPSIEDARGTSCVTPCGLHGPRRCRELVQLEHDFLWATDRYVDDWTAPEVCGALAGWSVAVHPDSGPPCPAGSWLLLPDFCVIGYTDTIAQMIYVAGSDWHRNALAHELIHVVDVHRNGRAGHCRWQERGVKAALRSVTGAEDPSTPELDCSSDSQ